jgi:L-threonylcarbamoyladenylate synthase
VTTVVDARGDPPPASAVAAAVEALRMGDIIAVPTDTVYGLAADPWHTGASDRLFRIKGRPRSVELPVFVAGADQALAVATGVPPAARRLMARLWPGALTIVVPRHPDVDADLGEEDETIGLRCPAHPVPLAICAAFGPVATTSANHHREPPATTAAAASFPGVAVVLDAGTCDAQPSTVVDCTGEQPKLLRPGRVAWEDIQAAVAGS